MRPKLWRLLPSLLTLAGLALMLGGGTMWWRQSRVEAALMARDERVLLAVTAPQPATLPNFEPPHVRAGVREPTSSPPDVPSTRPSRTPRPSAQEPDATPHVATPTPNPFPPAASVPTRVIAPAIALDAPVVEMGWETKQDAAGNPYSEWLVPDNAAGWHKNAALPGHGSNVVLSAHHNVAGEVFRYIVDLEPGNEVELEADGVRYRYIVEEKYIVKEKGESLEVRQENNRLIEPSEDERLTLVSCWPYETNTHRVIVIARPVRPAPIVSTPSPRELLMEEATP